MAEDKLENRLGQWRLKVNAASGFLDSQIFTLGEEIIKQRWALWEQNKGKTAKEKTPPPPSPPVNKPKGQKRPHEGEDGQDTDDDDTGKGGKPAAKKQKLDDGTGKKNDGTDGGKEIGAPGNDDDMGIVIEIPTPTDSSPLTSIGSDSGNDGKQGGNGTQDTGEKPQGPQIPEKRNETESGHVSGIQQTENPKQPLTEGPSGKSQEKQSRNTTQSYEDLENIELDDILLEDTTGSDAVQRALNARKINMSLKKPNGTLGPGLTCFADCIMQCLAAVLEPKWLKKSLGTHLQQRKPNGDRPIYRPFNDLFRTLQRIQDGGKGVVIDELADLVLIFDLHQRRHKFKTLAEWDDFKLQKQFEWHRSNKPPASAKQQEFKDAFLPLDEDDEGYSGHQQQDPALFLNNLLGRLRIGAPIYDNHEQDYAPHPIIDALITTDPIEKFQCNLCGAERQKDRPTELNFGFDIKPKYDEEPIENILKRMKENRSDEVQVACLACKENLAPQKKIWVGVHLPEILIVRSELQEFIGVDKNGAPISKKLLNNIRLADTLDMQAFSPDEGRTKYVLKAFTKHTGKVTWQGHHMAYVRGQNGAWWRCNGSGVGKLHSLEAAAKDTHGYDAATIYMIFYERLRDH